MRMDISSSRSNETGVLKHVDPYRCLFYLWMVLDPTPKTGRRIRLEGQALLDNCLESLREIQLWGTRVCWGPVTHWVTYLHIWQVAVVAPTCKQTLLSSVQGDPLLYQGDSAL